MAEVQAGRQAPRRQCECLQLEEMAQVPPQGKGRGRCVRVVLGLRASAR